MNPGGISSDRRKALVQAEQRAATLFDEIEQLQLIIGSNREMPASMQVDF